MQLSYISQVAPERTRIRYWRDLNGPEVDWVIEMPNRWIPIEVKWTDSPSLNDAKHLEIFLDEYKEAECGYIVCRTSNRMKLSNRVYAISWLDLCYTFP